MNKTPEAPIKVGTHVVIGGYMFAHGRGVSAVVTARDGDMLYVDRPGMLASGPWHVSHVKAEAS